jgi:excisionase family DNA binding protein
MHHTMITSVHESNHESITSALEKMLMQLSLSAIPALVGDLERLKMLAVARMITERLTPTPQSHDLLTMPEVAKRLNISDYRAYELGRHGILKIIHVGRSVRVEASEVSNYLARRGH